MNRVIMSSDSPLAVARGTLQDVAHRKIRAVHRTGTPAQQEALYDLVYQDHPRVRLSTVLKVTEEVAQCERPVRELLDGRWRSRTLYDS